MKILRSVLSDISTAVPDMPPETGGILGSTGGGIIDRMVMDCTPDHNARPCVYAPDTDFLNQCIGQWQENGIAFMGLFHTHFGGSRALSCGDIQYIRTIMEAMPETISYLYFPLFVLPDRILVCHKAYRQQDVIRIVQDELSVQADALSSLCGVGQIYDYQEVKSYE